MSSLKKEACDKVYFQQADKHQSFLQADLFGCAYNQACLKYLKQQVYNYLKENVKDEVLL